MHEWMLVVGGFVDDACGRLKVLITIVDAVELVVRAPPGRRTVGVCDGGNRADDACLESDASSDGGGCADVAPPEAPPEAPPDGECRGAVCCALNRDGDDSGGVEEAPRRAACGDSATTETDASDALDVCERSRCSWLQTGLCLRRCARGT